MDENTVNPVEVTANNDGAQIDFAAEIAKLREENDKLRKANTNASADASRYKKALQERMTEQERLDAARKEQEEQLQAELSALRRDKIVSDNVANFLSAGYSEELAKSSAEAMADNNQSALFADLKKFITQHDKDVAATMFRNTPSPHGGATNSHGNVTQEEFNNMNYSERLRLHSDSPELYAELSKRRE